MEEVFGRLGGRAVVLDGGFATELTEDGFSIEGDPLWSARVLVDCEEAIVKVHEKFMAAGAQVIETASYQACIPSLQEELGISKEMAESVVAKSVGLAKKARSNFCSASGKKEEEVVIAGSIGPYGCVLHDGSEYSGSYVNSMADQTIVDYHTEQIRVLTEAGAEVLAFDTIPSVAEARWISRALRSFHKHPPAWISFSCKEVEGGEISTNFGDSLEEVTGLVEEDQGLSGVGINCSAPSLVLPFLKVVKRKTQKPLLVYPNSGEDWEHGKGWFGGQKESGSLCSQAREWVDAGARAVGGCCRVGPKEIREIASVIPTL